METIYLNLALKNLATMKAKGHKVEKKEYPFLKPTLVIECLSGLEFNILFLETIKNTSRS